VGDAVDGGFGELIGVELLDLGADEARGRIAITDRHKQPHGVVHGGVYASLAETVASAAATAALREAGMIALGQMNSATFLRPISAGHVNATARTRHRGRTTWVWDVELTDDDGNLCALVRMTVAIRPRPTDAG
jgi:1,4-dihydroxy-2-naphthoyl-CoA hydrolase